MKASEVADGTGLTSLYLAQQAALYLGLGNLSAAEMFARRAHALEPDNPMPILTLATIAALIGREDTLDGLLTRLSNRASRTPPASAPRYIVIKAWSAGLWSDLNHVLGAILLADITGRVPVTLWGTESNYSNGSTYDAFSRFFEPLSDASGADLAAANLSVYPPRWTAGALLDEDPAYRSRSATASVHVLMTRTEDIIVSPGYIGVAELMTWIGPDSAYAGLSIEDAYRALISKHLRIRPDIIAKVDRFIADHFGGAPFLAVHLRGTDKIIECDDLDAINASYVGRLAELAPTGLIFLLSDDETWVTLLRERFGDRIVTTEATRASGRAGVHHTKALRGENIGVEMLVDFYIAMKATRLLGNGASNVSATLAVAKDWGVGNCALIEPSCLTEDMRHLVNTSEELRRSWRSFLPQHQDSVPLDPSMDMSLGEAVRARAGSVNVALGKSATQSSTCSYSRPDDAGGAVNGVVSGGFGFHTSQEFGPWWQVDLGSSYSIEQIVIYNRGDCLPERAYGFVLKLGDESGSFNSIYARRGMPFGGRENPACIQVGGKSARYVRIELETLDCLHLDEVEVYADV